MQFASEKVDMRMSNWKVRALAELSRAEDSRSQGNEGMARVCARRAAGFILGEYFSRNKEAAPNSAYARLQYLQAKTKNNSKLHAVLSHFLLRITPEHQLPVEADLIADARWLANELLGETV